ncbi:hypothetical protein PHSC3_001940 [Chlamydiales bacterium STE3]|nr:hypothetical protein PHSC3_001940 [Chlamydiales bacterium STE3]
MSRSVDTRTHLPPIDKICDFSKKMGRVVVDGACRVVNQTEGLKKLLQLSTSIIGVAASFTSVKACGPMVGAFKVVCVTIGGFEILNRIKDWVVPDKSGETLADKHWTKIVSRVHLTFASAIDCYKMLAYFKLIPMAKLASIGHRMGNVPVLRNAAKVLAHQFPGVDVIKHPFLIAASSWSILNTSLTISDQKERSKHIKHKASRWQELAGQDLEAQRDYIDERVAKYEACIAGNQESIDYPNRLRKLSKAQQKEIRVAQKRLAEYPQIVRGAEGGNSEHQAMISTFAFDKVEKWNVKNHNNRINLIKSAIAIACEVAKIAVIITALALSLSMVGWIYLPAVLAVLGLVSSGFSLTKFLVDQLVMTKAVPRVAAPAFSQAAT